MKYALILLSLLITSCFGQSPKLIPLPEYTPVIEKEDLGVGEYLKFNPYLDILFVIDDSGSMSEHQDNLSKNIDRFIDELSRFNLLKWQVGVTTSSIGLYGNYPNGAVVGEPSIINSQVINYRTALRKNLLVGTRGNATEIFLETAYMAITPPNIDGPNADMFRERAFLAIFFITDADDQGRLSPKYVYDELLKFKGNDPDLMTAYSVVIPATDSRCDRSGEDVPHRIEAFTSLMKGLTFSLCDPDFGYNLSRIGEDLLKRMSFIIQLKQVPVVSTIRVTYGSQVIQQDPSVGWSYSAKRNAILLGHNLVLEKEPKGTQIQVTFTPAILEP